MSRTRRTFNLAFKKEVIAYMEVGHSPYDAAKIFAKKNKPPTIPRIFDVGLQIETISRIILVQELESLVPGASQ